MIQIPGKLSAYRINPDRCPSQESFHEIIAYPVIKKLENIGNIHRCSIPENFFHYGKDPFKTLQIQVWNNKEKTG